MQELLKRDTRAEKAMTEPKLYAGLVFCGDCGRGMVSRKVKYKDTVNEYYIISAPVITEAGSVPVTVLRWM